MRYKLHVFPFSNYCEKVLWAFDQIGVEYAVETHLPGPHARRIKKLSGQTSVPVLEDGTQVITGSAAIIAHVLAESPSETLMPTQHSNEITRWQTKFDEVGATLRAALFYDLLPSPAVAITVLTMEQRHPLSGYGMFFRAMRPMLMRMLKKNVPDAAEARSQCATVLDEMMIALGKSQYLVGDRFTLADISAAAMFFPISMPDTAMGKNRSPDFPQMGTWRARWDGHPAIPYINDIYQQHRMVKGT